MHSLPLKPAQSKKKHVSTCFHAIPAADRCPPFPDRNPGMKGGSRLQATVRGTAFPSHEESIDCYKNNHRFTRNCGCLAKQIHLGEIEDFVGAAIQYGPQHEQAESFRLFVRDRRRHR